MVIFAFWSFLGHSSTASRQVRGGVRRARVMGCEPEVVGQGNGKVTAKGSYALPRATPPFRVARRVTLHRLVNFQIPIIFLNAILGKRCFVRPLEHRVEACAPKGSGDGALGWSGGRRSKNLKIREKVKKSFFPKSHEIA